MPNGGARPGAGRPEGSKNEWTLKKEQIAAEMEAKFVAHWQKKWDSITDAMEQLINGIYLEVPDGKGGTTRVYRRAPNMEAVKYAADRLMGKMKFANQYGPGEDGEGGAPPPAAVIQIVTPAAQQPPEVKVEIQKPDDDPIPPDDKAV